MKILLYFIIKYIDSITFKGYNIYKEGNKGAVKNDRTRKSC